MAVPHEMSIGREPGAGSADERRPVAIVDLTDGKLVGVGSGDQPSPSLPPPGGLYVNGVKRVFDIVAAGGAIALALPLLAAVALLVRVTMGGPVLFRQTRLGRDGVPFEVLKFRTMKPDRRADGLDRIRWGGEERRRTHKTAAHPLLTPVGRFLRRYSIDEFPQLFNVWRGEMSIVGPRPELPSVAASYEPWQYGRFLVRPGLTGLWQITARGNAPMHERTDLDIEYVATVSLRTDLRIIAATPKAMFGDHKGY